MSSKLEEIKELANEYICTCVKLRNIGYKLKSMGCHNMPNFYLSSVKYNLSKEEYEELTKVQAPINASEDRDGVVYYEFSHSDEPLQISYEDHTKEICEGCIIEYVDYDLFECAGDQDCHIVVRAEVLQPCEMGIPYEDYTERGWLVLNLEVVGSGTHPELIEELGKEFIRRNRTRELDTHKDIKYIDKVN